MYIGNRMNIDRRTAKSLEMITNAKNGNQKESLFGVINFTKTIVGARLLRSNLLRPYMDILTLNTRFDMIEFLLKNTHMFNNIIINLSK